MPEDTKRTSRGPSEGWTAMAAPEAGLEDGAAGRQHAVEGTTPSYSDLTALSPALFPFRSLPTPAAQGDDPQIYIPSKPALLYCPSSPLGCVWIFFYFRRLFQSHLDFYYY